MITDGLETAFQSKRLVFRALENNEDDRVFISTQIDNDPVNTALSDPALIQPRSLKRAETLVDNLTKATLAVMVCLREEDATEGEAKAKSLTPIGFVLVGGGNKPTDKVHHRNTSIGITLAAPYQGKGYGAEAIDWALDWAFRFGGYHRVAMNTVSYNERAQHLYKRLGFTEEGRIREAHWHDRKWYDTVNFGMLESEWAALRGL
ncbi:Fc.00g002050.m01.CDS01 [Cosmosporella sp. VM-42]